VILILLATYNGEAYIKEQLDSLLSQTVQEFKICILDDCSTDKTFDIVTEYMNKYPDRIVAARNEKNSGSPKHSFFKLMVTYKDDYLMLCDQDDVWKPDKIEYTLAEMKRMEQQYGEKTPILVYTDLTVVDSDLKVINPSFKSMLDVDYSRKSLQNLLGQNTLTGCTGMFNRALSDCIAQEPEYCVMHDWWLILVACCFGEISALDKQTIFYRQHHDNTVGASDVKSLSYQIRRFFRGDDVRRAIEITYLQAQSLYDVYKDKLSEKQKTVIQDYLSIPHLAKVKRIQKIIQGGYLKNTFVRKLGHILYV
jgi:Glycosyltransferases involved in cell wall biogenesis